MTLAWNRYGKARVRLVKIDRRREPHQILDLTIDVQLEGAFESVYVNGDNQACLATDTMKNTVYAFAGRGPIESVEAFASDLAVHFTGQRAVSRARIAATEHRWDQITAGGRPHPHAFVKPGGEQWTVVVTCDAAGLVVESGLTGLVVLKTTDSAFTGFPRDDYTTLHDTTDRILATSINATWRYRSGTTAFGARDDVRRALVETFAAHDSRSVQHTLYAMGQATLAACPDIVDITLVLPNQHHLLVDLSPFGLDNPNEVFIATDQPYGLIEGTVRR